MITRGSVASLRYIRQDGISRGLKGDQLFQGEVVSPLQRSPRIHTIPNCGEHYNMEVFKHAQYHPYHLGQVFSMPRDDGDTPAIAVSYLTATYLLPAYTFLIILIFTALWRIFINFAIRFYPSCSRLRGNRYVAIAGIASAGGAWDMGYLMVQYCWTMLYKARDIRSGLLAALVLAGSLILGTSRIVAGITIPTTLIIGNVAPVDASFIFFPPSLNLERVDYSMVFFRAITQNSAQLATSYLANTQETLLESGPNGQVSINFTDLPATASGKGLQMDYRYKVTGVNLGLQFASGLSKTIKGSCETIYNFTTDNEWWGISSSIAYHEQSVLPPPDLTPTVFFRYVGEEFDFFIVLNAEGLDSQGESDDPWYATGQGDGEGSERTFKILPNRPVVYCRQTEMWKYGVHQVTGNTSIAELPGLKLKPVIRNYLQNPLNRLAPIALLPLLLGDRMMLASSTAVEGVFDASIYDIRDELRRLIALSYVLESDILRRTVTNSPSRTKYANPALVDGIKADGVDDFVVYSSDVATLSLKTLIAVPATLLVVVLIMLSLEVNTCANGNRGPGARYHIRRTAFNPMQMYRHLDEATGGNHIWKGRTSDVPYVKNSGPGYVNEDAPEFDTQTRKASTFVAPKVVDRQGRTPGADIKFTRLWDPELSVPWKDVGASRLLAQSKE